MALRFAVAVMALLGLGGIPAEAQPQPKAKLKVFGKGPAARAESLEQFRRLTPEERDAALRNLPPERRQMMERRLEQWENLTPEQKKRLEGSYARFRELPPERQQEVRQLYRRFSETFTPERRPAALLVIRRLRIADTEQRTRILESKRYRDTYNENERKLIEQMAADLPEPE
jgi:hypothetical protein